MLPFAIFHDGYDGLRRHSALDHSMKDFNCVFLKVSQYICGDDMGGPPDCLQYFTATSGKVARFVKNIFA